MTGINRMRAELVKDRLRRDYQEAINTLIAAGISEEDANIAAVDALERLLMEVTDGNAKGQK